PAALRRVDRAGSFDAGRRRGALPGRGGRGRRMSFLESASVRPPALALNLELSHGARGASARIEILERDGSRIALLALRGWVGPPAASRLALALEDLAARGVDQLLLDCSALRHIDYRVLPDLITSLGRFESRAGGIVVCG